jgi:hypothetical protein
LLKCDFANFLYFNGDLRPPVYADNTPPSIYLPLDDGQIDPYIDPASGVLRNNFGPAPVHE